MHKEKIFTIVASSAVGTIVLSLIVFAVVSRKVYRRSLMASLVALFLRLTVHHKSDEQVVKDISLLPLTNDCPYTVPRSVRTNRQCRYDLDGMTVFAVNCNGSANRVIIYLHGGGYVRQPRLHHWKYINKLAKRCGNVIVPIYPKAPCHHPRESFELLTKLYVKLNKHYDQIVLMGDSSGGGLALALCQHWGEMGLKQPAKTLLFSPWVDLTLNNHEIDQYQKKDPLICAASERIWAKVWAQDMQLDDWHLSPAFGPMDKLGEVIVYCGDCEVLYPDIRLLYESMKQQGANVRYVEGKGMNHVYQIYPIPEAHAAFKQVVKEIELIK